MRTTLFWPDRHQPPAPEPLLHRHLCAASGLSPGVSVAALPASPALQSREPTGPGALQGGPGAHSLGALPRGVEVGAGGSECPRSSHHTPHWGHYSRFPECSCATQPRAHAAGPAPVLEQGPAAAGQEAAARGGGLTWWQDLPSCIQLPGDVPGSVPRRRGLNRPTRTASLAAQLLSCQASCMASARFMPTSLPQHRTCSICPASRQGFTGLPLGQRQAHKEPPSSEWVAFEDMGPESRTPGSA